jgi:MFS family permease
MPTLSALRGNRNLTVLAAGSGVSSVGSQLTLVGFTTVLHNSGSFAVAGLFVSCTVGAVLGAPLAGRLVDRCRNRPLLVGTLLTQAVILTCLLLGYHQQAVLFPMMGLMGLSGTVVGTCASVLVPLTTGEDDAMRGYAWLTTAQKTGSMSGTILGGVIAAGPGIELALVVDAITSVIQAALIVAFMTVDRDPRVADAKAGKAKGTAAGLSYLWQDRLLLGRVMAQTVAGIAVSIALVNEVFLVTGPIGGDNFTYSVMLMFWAAGLLLGANLSRRLKGARLLLRTCVVSSAVMAIVLLAPALLPYTAVNAAAWLIVGGCSSVQNVTLNGFVQERTADALRGRMFAAVSAVTVSATTLSILAAGGVVALSGPRTALIVAAFVAAVAAVVAWIVTVSSRELRAPVDESAALP